MSVSFDAKSGILYVNGHAFLLTEDEQWALAVDLSRALFTTAIIRNLVRQKP